MWTLHALRCAVFRAPPALVAVLVTARGSAGAQLPDPTFLRVGVEHRIRLEQLERDFRATPFDGLTAAALRTVLTAQVGRPAERLVIEVADSRVYTENGVTLGTSQVNAMELLAAHLAWSAGDVYEDGDSLSVRLGRLTMDLGSRRLLARNVFRNTINAFTGLDVAWSTPARGARAFLLFPVVRRPSDASSLASNGVRLDKEDTDALLWGLEYRRALAGWGRLEAYLVGYDEWHRGVTVVNPALFVWGARLKRDPAPHRVDYDLEGILERGRSAIAPFLNTFRKDASALHASVGYLAAGPATPRVVLQYDYASGDEDRLDTADQRFDPLFGARAFELGATGFYGAFARSNIRSPGLRVELRPLARLDVMAAYRLYWLASSTDAWITSDYRDVTGDSGTFVGGQGETGVRARLIPGMATLDLGGAVLSRGAFARSAPGGRTAAAIYFYSQLTLTGDLS